MTPRARQTALAIAAVAALLAGCSREAAAPPVQPQPPQAPAAEAPAMNVPTPAPTSAPVPAPGGVMPAAIPCMSNQLKLSADGGDAGMGHRLVTLGVQNVGREACSFTGYPTVTLFDGRNRPVTTIKIDQHPGSYLSSGRAPTPVDLAPQAKGYFDLAWVVVPNEGAGEKVCPEVASIRFRPPGDTAAITYNQALTPCGGRMDVSPVRPMLDDVPAGSAPAT